MQVGALPYLVRDWSDMQTGGLIALGIGKYYWTAQECIEKFEGFVNTGFVNKPFTMAWATSWIARWFRGSIYKSDVFEWALASRYKDRPFFGLASASNGHIVRVAVTTTVGTDRKLIANYRRGGTGPSGEYLDSTSPTWHA